MPFKKKLKLKPSTYTSLSFSLSHYLLHIDPWSIRQSEISLYRKHLYKLVEAVWWLNGNVWVLWNDIGRCSREIRRVPVLNKSQNCDQKRYGQRPTKPLTVSLRLSTLHGREAEEVIYWALKIRQHGMVKRRSYGSIWQSPFVSVCLTERLRRSYGSIWLSVFVFLRHRSPLCLSHTTEALTSFKNSVSVIFL